MRHPIDPTVDVVFKAILGSNHHRNLLIHFVNAILGYQEGKRVVEVTLHNPYNLKDYRDGKLSVVDVKAIDQVGREFQIDIQISSHAALPERMAYNWAAMYYAKIKEGHGYTALNPVIAIWLLCDNLPALPSPHPESKRLVDLVHVPFGIYSPEAEVWLTEHCGIHVRS